MVWATWSGGAVWSTWSGARHRDHRDPLWASTVSRRLPEASSKICSFPLCRGGKQQSVSTPRPHGGHVVGGAPTYLGPQDDLPVSGHEQRAQGVLARHGADHLQRGPVPDLRRVAGGGEHGEVVGAEAQRAHVGAVAGEREARRLVGVGGAGARARGLQAVGLQRVVLQEQRHLQLAARARQAVHPPGKGEELGEESRARVLR